MDKFAVRFTIFFCSIYFIYVLYYAWNGENVFDDTYKLLLELSLYLTAKSNLHYNCRYARFLALNLFMTEALTYVDSTYCLFEDAETLLTILSVSWSLAVTATIVLAVNHFRRVRNVKRMRE